MPGRQLRVASLRHRESGQGLVEYALVLVLVAVVSIVILSVMGGGVRETLCTVVQKLGQSCAGNAPAQEVLDTGGEEIVEEEEEEEREGNCSSPESVLEAAVSYTTINGIDIPIHVTGAQNLHLTVVAGDQDLGMGLNGSTSSAGAVSATRSASLSLSAEDDTVWIFVAPLPGNTLPTTFTVHVTCTQISIV